MKVVFIEAPAVTRWRDEYLDDESFARLQAMLLASPFAGVVIPGTAGFRKLRWPDQRHGKEARTMKSRRLADELTEGIEAMGAHRTGKITLRTHEVEILPPLSVSGAAIRATRERMGVSRAVFARRLRVSMRTLESWEQGRSSPNAQAAALILMVRAFPDTLTRLACLNGPGR